MKRLLSIPTILFVLLAFGLADAAHSADRTTIMGRIAQRRAASSSWHGNYYSPAWGMPVAVVVPPKAQSQTNWGWGVGNTRVTGVPHQYERGYPISGPYQGPAFQPTPAWPTDTTQFGSYYIRGPW